MSPAASLSCLGLVLAGGQSSRMGTDKAKLEHPTPNSFTKQTMAEFSRQLLLTAGAQEVVLSGENIDGIKDDYPLGGPLSGILTIIQRYQPSALLITPVDMPYMEAKALAKLKQIGELGHCAAYFDNSHLPLYLPVNDLIIDVLSHQFNSEQFKQTGKGPSFKQIIKMANGKSVSCSNPRLLINTNTPGEWQRACQELSAEKTHLGSVI